jgi:ATP-dependent DNA helicase RecG
VITDGIEPATSFREIHVLSTPQGRVVLFEIPAAWQGRFYARNHDSLSPLSLVKQDQIRLQDASQDWSAVVCPHATVDDLDPAALAKARDIFASRYSSRIPEATIRGWSNAECLAQAKLTIQGGITRAALLLLGKPQATHHLSPHVVELTWKLEGPERAYEHFHPGNSSRSTSRNTTRPSCWRLCTTALPTKTTAPESAC